MMPGIFGGIIAMVLVRYLFPIWFALPKGYAESGPSATEIAKGFAERGIKPEGRAAVLALLPVIAWCAFVGVVALLCGQRGKGGQDPILLPDGVFYLLPALFGSIGVAGWGYGEAIRRLFRGKGTGGDDDYALYVRLHNLKSNYRVENVSRTLLGVVLVPSILMLVLVGDNYTRIAKDGIVLNPFLSIGETRHAYSDVERIVTAPRLYAPNGNAVERRVYVVYFKGGDKWNSDNAPGEYSETEYRELVNGIATKSGVVVTEKEILDRDEL